MVIPRRQRRTRMMPLPCHSYRVTLSIIEHCTPNTECRTPNVEPCCGWGLPLSGSKEVAEEDAHDAERALVLEAFGGFVEFLHGELGVAVEFRVVDNLGDGALALVHFFEDFPEVGHR